MTKARIAELTALLPEEASCVTEYSRNYRHPFSYIFPHWQVEANALQPDFGWKFSKALVAADLALPDCIHEPNLRRAYRHLRQGVPDYEIEVGSTLTNEFLGNIRLALQAGLLQPSMPLSTVASMSGVTPSFADVYHDLFFAVRERMEDQLYLSFIVSACQIEALHVQGQRGELTRELLLLARDHNHNLSASQMVVA